MNKGFFGFLVFKRCFYIIKIRKGQSPFLSGIASALKFGCCAGKVFFPTPPALAQAREHRSRCVDVLRLLE